jgi:thioredoxin reductase
MTHKRDYLIIGAGPAGLQLGFYLQQRGLNYLILEGSDKPGHFFEHQPRHRQLISINKKYTGYEDPEINLRWDWNSLLSDYQKNP